uniref:Saposin B-type domain-containing protein n=1 Tax=Plectus sambesii TaxID=2011161 RepID=A0A914XQ62_9BILA
MTTESGLVLLVYFIISPVACQIASDTPIPLATTLPTVEAPSLSLGCSICKTLVNTSLAHPSASLSELTELLTEQCSNWVFFKDICTKTVTMYANRFQSQPSKTVAQQPHQICKLIGLCSEDRVPAFCNKYWHDEENDPPN